VELGFGLRRTRLQPLLVDAVVHPRLLHVEGTNVCNARCSFCAYGKVETPKRVMPIDLFRRAVDDFVALGGVRVSLTPVLGDPLIDPLLLERLDVIHMHPSIERVSFHTNGISLHPGIQDRLLRYDRLSITVSWGGFDRDSYKKVMGVDRFDAVRRNVLSFAALIAERRPAFRLAVGVRGPIRGRSGETWEDLRYWEARGALRLTFVDEYDSWGGIVTSGDVPDGAIRPSTARRGACQRMLGSPLVLADGRVNACPCRDVESKLLVGDLTHESLREICEGKRMLELLERQEKGDFPDVCLRCSYYLSAYDFRRATWRTRRRWF
jgi:MoaA/NifB/PqqE/SkfB family radical SAM enzyme